MFVIFTTKWTKMRIIDGLRLDPFGWNFQPLL